MDHFEDFKGTESLAERPNSLHALLHLVLVFLFFIGSLFVLGGLGALVCSYLLTGEAAEMSSLLTLVEDLKSHPYILKLFVVISSSLPMIVAALITLIFIKATAKDYLLLHFPKNLKWFILSIIFVGISIFLLEFMLDINKLIDFEQWPEFYKKLVASEKNNNSLYEALAGGKGFMPLATSILVMALIPAIAEEIFFRGFLMNAFNGLFKNMHVAIVITAIIFSLIHMQFTKIVPMFFLAVVFGYAAYWTGTIWTSIVAHFINNTFAVVLLYQNGGMDYAKTAEQGLNLAPWQTAVVGVCFLAMFIFLQRNASPKTENFYV